MINADDFFQRMKQEIDAIVADDADIQEWLSQVMNIAKSVTFSAEEPPIRAFYLALFLNLDFELCLAFEFNLSTIFGISSFIQIPPDFILSLRLAGISNPELERNLELAIKLDDVLNSDNSGTLTRELAEILESVRAIVIADFDIDNDWQRALKSADYLVYKLAFKPNLNLLVNFLIIQLREIILTLEPGRDIDKFKPGLKQKLKMLQDQLEQNNENVEIFERWWQINRESWTTELKNVIGSDFINSNSMFDEQQQELLKQYYDANKLLVEGLKNNHRVSTEVRKEIEETLLLPIEEIEKRQQQM